MNNNCTTETSVTLHAYSFLLKNLSSNFHTIESAVNEKCLMEKKFKKLVFSAKLVRSLNTFYPAFLGYKILNANFMKIGY